METFIEKLMNMKGLLVCLFIGSLVLLEFIRFKKQMYYNDPVQYPTMKDHILNRQYQLHLRKNINYKTVNRILFLSTTTLIVLSSIVMYFNLIVGVVVFIVSSTISTYKINEYLDKKFI